MILFVHHKSLILIKKALLLSVTGALFVYVLSFMKTTDLW